MHQAAAEGVETPGPWSGLGSEGGKKSLEVGGGKRRGGKGVLTSASRQKVNCASSQHQPVLGPRLGSGSRQQQAPCRVGAES